MCIYIYQFLLKFDEKQKKHGSLGAGFTHPHKIFFSESFKHYPNQNTFLVIYHNTNLDFNSFSD